MAEWAYGPHLPIRITMTRSGQSVDLNGWNVRSCPHRSDHGTDAAWHDLLHCLSMACLSTQSLRGKTVERVDVKINELGYCNAFVTLQPGATVWLIDDQLMRQDPMWRRVHSKLQSLALTDLPVADDHPGIMDAT